MKRKKTAMIFLLLVCSLFCLNATIVKKESHGFDIQGGYSDFFAISVKLLDAPSLGYTAGMPFNVLSDNLNPKHTDDGILIANWTMLTNQKNYTFGITCDPLKLVSGTADENKDPSNEINYILTIKYELSIYEGGHSTKMNATKFMIASDGSINDSTPRNPINDTTVIDTGSLMGSNNGEIYIKLLPSNYDMVPTTDEKGNAVEKRKLDIAKDGNYQGSVKIVMKMVE